MKNCKKICEKPGGWRFFTLTELLVVMGILLILAIIAGGAMFGIMERADTARCASNLRQIGVAHTNYQDDNYSNVAHHRHWVDNVHDNYDIHKEMLQCPEVLVSITSPNGGNTSYIMNIIRNTQTPDPNNEAENQNRYKDPATERTWEIRGWQDGVNAGKIRRPESTIFLTEISETFNNLEDKNRSYNNAGEGIFHMGYPVEQDDGSVTERWWYDSSEDNKWSNDWEDPWNEFEYSDTDLGHRTITDNEYKNRRQVGNHHGGGFNALLGGGAVQHMTESLPQQWIGYEEIDD